MFGTPDVSIHASSREDATHGVPTDIKSDSFQSTRPRGRTRQVMGITPAKITVFQSTRPRGRTRRTVFSGVLFYPCFNPRVLAGGRDVTETPHCKSACFNPRVLAGGRDARLFGILAVDAFQSTRPRGRTRPLAIPRSYMCPVSIHASSREDATEVSKHFGIVPSVSIHASSREDATSLPKRSSIWLDVFHSTRPRRRPRRQHHTGQRIPDRFNPRVLAGGRDRMKRFDIFIAVFQSTRPRGRTRPS